MIIQEKNKYKREIDVHNDDIAYLKQFYAKNKKFPLFSQVLIETRTDCNNRCRFCPQSFNNKDLGIMSWKCYTTIIDQLFSIKYNGRIALMLSNEPLLEERLIEMILYAKNKSQRFFLDITTNGILLTLEKLDALFQAGLDNIRINDYRSDRDLFPNKWTSNLSVIFDAYNNNPKVFMKNRRTDECLPNYAGNIPQTFDKELFGFCNFPFRKLTIAYTGDILLCCNDFMYKTYFGNVMNESLFDCWYKPAIDEIRLALLKNKRIGLCERCNDIQDYNVFA